MSEKYKTWLSMGTQGRRTSSSRQGNRQRTASTLVSPAGPGPVR